MTGEDPTPDELEAREEYEEAATAYAKSGFDNLLKEHFELNLGTRMGIGSLLLAISADRRANNIQRPNKISDICRPLLQEIQRTSDDPILCGLVSEWLGDMTVMLGQDDAIIANKWYTKADEKYEGMDWQDERWADEPDFVFAYLAFRRFSEFHDGPIPESPDTLSFQKRVKLKQKFANELLDGDNS